MRFLLLALFLVGVAVPASAQLPGLGVKHRGSIIVADRSFPLLDGEWTVVAAGASRSSSGRAGIDRVYLAQMDGNRLSRWIYISTNTEWNPGGWDRNKAVCDRKDVHASFSDSNNSSKDIECWILNHVGMTLGRDPSQVDIDFFRWSDARGRPNTALALTYYFSRKGDFFRIDYYFNPVLAGFRDTAGGGSRGSPWHPDIASKDTRKLAYLRTLKTQGEELFGRLGAVLR